MFERVPYSDLNSRQKENYNFHKVAGELADYGFNCLRLNDDWQGADFLACHVDGELFLKIQLKGRMTIDMKYWGKDIHIAFLNADACYVYPHDEFLQRVLDASKAGESDAWKTTGVYSWGRPPRWAQIILNDYKI